MICLTNAKNQSLFDLQYHNIYDEHKKTNVVKLASWFVEHAVLKCYDRIRKWFVKACSSILDSPHRYTRPTRLVYQPQGRPSRRDANTDLGPDQVISVQLLRSINANLRILYSGTISETIIMVNACLFRRARLGLNKILSNRNRCLVNVPTGTYFVTVFGRICQLNLSAGCERFYLTMHLYTFGYHLQARLIQKSHLITGPLFCGKKNNLLM